MKTVTVVSQAVCKKYYHEKGMAAKRKAVTNWLSSLFVMTYYKEFVDKQKVQCVIEIKCC